MFVSALQLVEIALEDINIVSSTMIGDTNIKERLNILDAFKNTQKVDVLLVHYKVGGEGINLTEATHVIPLEPWWTHAVHNQGIFRAWRRGQKHTVTVHWVLTLSTIEKAILSLCDNKQQMSDYYLYGTTHNDNLSTGLNRFELRKLLNMT